MGTAFALGVVLGAVVWSAGCDNGDRELAAGLAVPVQRSDWRQGGLTGLQLDTQHYRICTTVTENRAMLAYLPGFMEGAYEHYLRLTGLGEPARTRPMPVYLLGDRQQWAEITRQITGANSEVFLAIENGGYCYRGACVFWDMGQFATFSIAAHEGLHQFFFHRLKDPIPPWAEEGLCVTAEGYNIGPSGVRFTPQRNTLRMNDLRNVLTGGRWIGLARLLSRDAGDNVADSPFTASEYYGQLWALLMYVRSDPKTRAGLERMLADAADGRLRAKLKAPDAMGAGRTYVRSIGEPVFRLYISDDLPGFDRRLRDYAAGLAKLR